VGYLKDVDNNFMQLNNCLLSAESTSRLASYRFPFNNQPDALIIQIYSVIKLRVLGIFLVHHQEFSTVHSALVIFMQVLMTVSKQNQDGRGHQNLHETYQCRMYIRKLLMMGKEDARNT
jgi:hypothetical protein